MSTRTQQTPLSEILGEARRLLALAEERTVPMRLVGGIAIRIRSDEAYHPCLERAYKDIDVLTPGKGGPDTASLLYDAGYEPSREFNGLNGHRRLLFLDAHNERKLDVFVGEFSMCHAIPMRARAMLEPGTVPLAELMLMKLQIVELTEKVLRDVVALLHYHDVGEADGEMINAGYIARLCAGDWGLWRTCKLNLERVRDALPGYKFTGAERDVVADRLERLWARIESEPKPSRWRMRDRIGDRKRWYEEPDEVE